MSLEQQSRSALVARIEGLVLCPVTLDPMADPVITSDGQTYDRSAIETWFNSGKTTSPATGAVLDNLNLVTPIALRYAIHETFPEAREQFEAALQANGTSSLDSEGRTQAGPAAGPVLAWGILIKRILLPAFLAFLFHRLLALLIILYEVGYEVGYKDGQRDAKEAAEAACWSRVAADQGNAFVQNFFDLFWVGSATGWW